MELDDSILNDDVICYRILEKGSKCGGRLLVVSNGYIYGLKVYIFIMRIKLDNKFIILYWKLIIKFKFKFNVMLYLFYYKDKIVLVYNIMLDFDLKF